MPGVTGLQVEVVVGGTLATDGGNGKDEVPYSIFLVYTAALTQKQTCLGPDSTQQVHDNGGIRTSHTKINDGHSFCTGRYHVGIFTENGNIELFCENLYVLVEVGQQNVLSKILQVTLCVTGQPIGYDFFFCFHKISLNLCSQKTGTII